MAAIAGTAAARLTATSCSPLTCPSWRKHLAALSPLLKSTADDIMAQVWIALAKPSQAPTLVLAAVPEGWTAEVLSARTRYQGETYER